MAKTVWDTLNGTEQALVGQYGNIAALFQQLPEATEGPMASVGEKMRAALKPSFLPDLDFAKKFDAALSKPETLKAIVDASAQNPAGLDQSIGDLIVKVKGGMDSEALLQGVQPLVSTDAAPTAPAPVAPEPAPAPVVEAAAEPVVPVQPEAAESDVPVEPTVEPEQDKIAQLQAEREAAKTAEAEQAHKDAFNKYHDEQERLAQSVEGLSKIDGFEEFVAEVEKHPELKRVMEDFMAGDDKALQNVDMNDATSLNAASEALAKKNASLDKFIEASKKNPGMMKDVLKLMQENPQLVADNAEKFLQDPEGMMGQIKQLEQMQQMMGGIRDMLGKFSPQLAGLFDKVMGFLGPMMGLPALTQNVAALENAGQAGGPQVFGASNSGNSLAVSFLQPGTSVTQPDGRVLTTPAGTDPAAPQPFDPRNAVRIPGMPSPEFGTP